jgi:hypothetical protein
MIYQKSHNPRPRRQTRRKEKKKRRRRRGYPAW